MGQRLEILIMKNGKELANAYYHWSAYTSSSFELAKEIVMAIKARRVRQKDEIKKAIRLLEITGAGVTQNEKDYLKVGGRFKNFKFMPCNGRNEGLIAVSPEGMKETRDWQEGQVFIDIGKRKVSFDVWSCFNGEEELKEYCEDEKIEPKRLGNSLESWVSYDDFLDMADEYRDGDWYQCGDVYYHGIE